MCGSCCHYSYVDMRSSTGDLLFGDPEQTPGNIQTDEQKEGEQTSSFFFFKLVSPAE